MLEDQARSVTALFGFCSFLFLLLTGGVNSVLVGHDLPELGTDLVTALSSLDVNNFALKEEEEEEEEGGEGGLENHVGQSSVEFVNK